MGLGVVRCTLLSSMPAREQNGDTMVCLDICCCCIPQLHFAEGAEMDCPLQMSCSHQCAIKLARKLDAHSVMSTSLLPKEREKSTQAKVIKRRAENKNTSHSQVLELDACSEPPDPH
eukprot:187130-Pelagomonas_calceolata.AAC.4